MRTPTWLKVCMAGGTVILVAGISLGLFIRSGKEKNKAWAAYRSYEESLRRAVEENDFAYDFASPEDQGELRKAFAFLEREPNAEAKVVALIEWINANMDRREVLSVRALDLYKEKSAACEVHALAAGVLGAFGIKARWISGVESSLGFGYLEAFTEGRWQLFKLRDPANMKLNKSAWELFNESEPSLNIRTFHLKPDQATKSWRGSVYPVVFSAANAQIHRRLMPLFTSDKGVKLDPERFNPYSYVYAWWADADGPWIRTHDSPARFEGAYRRWQEERSRLVLDLGVVRVYRSDPEEYIPSPKEFRLVFP